MPREVLLGALCWVCLFQTDGWTTEEVELLGARTAWRFYAAYYWPADTPIPFPQGRWVAVGEGVSSPPPPPDWMQPDCDDYGWPRVPLPICGSPPGMRRSPATIIRARGKFAVAEPKQVKQLKLHICFWGAPSIYLNGTAVAIRTDAKAIEMPSEIGSGKGKAGELQPMHELEIELPGNALRPGVNVLALEFRQEPTVTPGPEKNIGLFKAVLSARRAAAVGSGGLATNAPPSDGVSIWAADPTAPPYTVEYADPCEPPRVRARAPLNGFGSAQVVLCGPADFKGITAKASELRSAEGQTIPAQAVRIRYMRISDPFLALLDEPSTEPDAQRPPYRPKRRDEPRPEEGRRWLPIWLTFNVPLTAQPGKYSGTLHLHGLPKPIAVPIELTVYGWQIGSPREWKTAVNLLQSPESVAGYYKVPMWSDEHFALLEKSLALMGEAGNDVLGINAVGKTVFGDDPLVLFRRQGNKLVPELKFLERYLALYHQYCGEPTFLCVQVWHYGMSFRGMGRDGGTEAKLADTIPLVEIRGNELAPIEYPMYGQPGTEELWREVMEGIRRCIAKLGWRQECLLLGTSGDNWPNPEIVDFFKKVAPYARWRAITHGSGAPKWGLTAEERTQPNGMVVDYLEWARRIAYRRVHVPGCLISGNARDECGSDPFCYWSLPVCNVFPAGYQGFAWKGLDYWPYPTADGTLRSALNTYVRFGNVVGSTPRTLAMPGPRGAVATAQFECLREGTQDTEAMLYIRAALTDPQARAKLGEELAGQCQTAMDELWSYLEIGLRTRPQGGGDLFRLSCRIHQLAAAVAAALANK